MVNGTLKEYQITGLEWLVSLYNNKLNGILADEMGLGKTIQTISLVTYLVEVKMNKGPYLVIVPLSTLPNWVMEFEKWAPSLICITYRGSPPHRKQLAAQVSAGKFNVVLTTYEFIIRDVSVLGKVDWRYTIVDEGHRMKNANSKLSVMFHQNYKSPRRLLLTGTPLQNNLPELWALLNFILPSVFKSSSSFDEWFSAPFAGTAEQLSMNDEEKMLVIQRLHKVLRPFMLRRLKKDVEKQLPDKVEHVLRCDMSVLQRRLYRYMKLHNVLLQEDDDEMGGSRNAQPKGGHRALQNRIMQLRKIVNHPYLFRAVEGSMIKHIGNNPDDLWRCSGKFELLGRIIPKFQATGHRMLIFCQMTNLMTIMEDYFNHLGIKYLRLDGTTKSEERGGLLKEFNSPGSIYDVFMLSTRAGGLGLNLQTADTVIIFDSDWNPHQDLQAQDRAHRIGQKQEVRVYRLCTVNSVEEHILAAARFKLNMDAQVIQAGMFNHQADQKTQKSMLTDILENEDKEEDDDEVLGEGEDDLLNELLARNESELEQFHEMDRVREQDDAKVWMDDVRRTRLMQAHELPQWALRDDEDVLAQVQVAEAEAEGPKEEEYSGRGARQRKVVSYADSMSEKAWLDSIEDGTFHDKEDKIQKRLKKQLDDELTDHAAVAAAAVQKLQEEAKAKEVGAKRAEIPDAVLRHVELLSTAVATHCERDGSFTVKLLAVPDRAAEPEYFRRVTQPLSIADVKDRSASGDYASVEALSNDLDTMFHNAKKAHGDGSKPHEAAKTLSGVFNALREQLCGGSGDGPSSKKRKLSGPETETEAPALGTSNGAGS